MPANPAIAIKAPTQRHTDAASPWPTFWIASVAVFLVSLDTTMLFAAFRAVRAGFPGTSAADMSWVLNGYTVVYAAMLIPAGGLAGNVSMLIAARVAQAFGAALLTPASLSIVLSAFPQTRRAVAVSLWGAVGGFAAAVGPSVGSFVVDSVGWPWAFWLQCEPPRIGPVTA